MRAEKSKMASKMAAIIRNRGQRYLVCSNFIKNVFTTNKTPRMCPNITKVIIHKFIWLLKLKVKVIYKVKCQNCIKNMYHGYNFILLRFLYPF